MAEPTMKMIAVDEIAPDPANLRGEVDAADLVDSVRAHGVLQPLLVRPDDANGGYVIVSGHRRHKAALVAEIAEVPCMVREASGESDWAQWQLVENMQRHDLAPSEEAVGYSRLSEAGWTVEDLARTVGRSVNHVRSRIGLLALPEDVLTMVDAGEVSLAAAGELAGILGEDDVTDEMVVEAAGEVRDRPHQPADRIVASRLAEVRRDRALAEVVDRFESRGYTEGDQFVVLRTMADRHRLEETGWREINDRVAFDREPIRLDDDGVAALKADGEKLRFIIDASRQGEPRVILATADPKAHTTKRAEKEGGIPDAEYERRKEEREARRREREERREREQREREWRGRVVAAAKKDEAVAVAVGRLLAEAEADWRLAQEVCVLMGVEEPVEREMPVYRSDGTVEQRSQADWPETVRRSVPEKLHTAAALRWALAVAMVRYPGGSLEQAARDRMLESIGEKEDG